MGRLIGALGSLWVYFCVATILTLAGGVGYAWSTGAIDAHRLEQMLAILHGMDLAAAAKPVDKVVRADASREQTSVEAIEQARSLKWRDFELRERILLDTFNELKKVQAALEDEKDRFGNVTKAFEKKLKDMESGDTAKGRLDFQRIVESMKPKQAKEQLLIKHKAGKIDVVVDVLRGMEESKRAKIVAEFKAQEDNQVLSEILERIRNPDLSWIQDARKSLSANDQTP